MRGAVRFDLDHAGLARLLSAAEAERVLTNVAQGIAKDWQRNDPRNRPGGHQPPNIEVSSPTREAGVASVSVFTNDGLWHIIEYGSVNNEPYLPATRAVRANGLELHDRGR